MTSAEFPETSEALKDLQNLFKCKSCGKLAESPCTLGGCEHIFCNTCCDINLEKNECPLCNVHVNVKAAQVNRQIYNVVRLCQRLEAVLTDTDNNSYVQTQKTESHSDLICDTETIAGNIGSYRSPSNRINSKKADKSVDHTSMKNKKEQLDDVSLNDHERETQSSKDRRKRRSVPVDQRTMTQMLLESDQEHEEEEMNFSEEEEQTPPKNKKKRKIKGNKLLKSGTPYPIDQTTMSQYFDYTDVEDGSFDGVQDGKMETIIKNETTKTSDKKKKLHKNQTRNLRTRSKDMKVNNSDTETPSPIRKPSRRHSLGAVTSRVQELRDEQTITTADKKARRGLSPNKSSNIKSRSNSPKQQSCDTSINVSPQQQGKRKSKDKLNTSVTGSGKKNVDPLLKKNAKGETPLQVAAIKGDIKRIEELLKAGALPNARDNAGWTPLHEAVHYGHTEIAKKLLDHGAMINVPGTENDTPLHDALRQGQLDCVRLLVSYGACLTSRNIHGLTPEDFAVTEDMKAALSTDITTASKTTEVVDVLEYQQPCLLHTALSREQKILLQKCATVIQGRVVEDFCPEVTHIVTSCNKDGMCARTFKYMHGVVNGKWIVNFEWVNMCLEFGDKVCEEAFEIPGSSQNIESHAAEKGRINRKNQQPKLFDGYQFYFCGNFEYPTPQKEDLIELVKSGGGQILTREPKLDHIPKIPTVPYHAPNSGPLSKCYIFVVHDNNSHNEPIRKEKICSVSVAWILDCIGLFQIKQNVEI